MGQAFIDRDKTTDRKDLNQYKKTAGSYRHLIRRYKEIRRVDEQTSPPR